MAFVDYNEVQKRELRPTLLIPIEKFIDKINDLFQKASLMNAYSRNDIFNEQDPSHKEILAWFEKVVYELQVSFNYTDNIYVDQFKSGLMINRDKSLKNIINNLFIKLCFIASEVSQTKYTINWKGPKLIEAIKNRIFIVHGRNEKIRNEVEQYLNDLGLADSIVLFKEPNQGSPTLIEKLERAAKETCFSIVLLTADDKGRLKNRWICESRARQNVVFEMGYFMAELGRRNVICLKEEKLKDPSDISGIVYVPLDSNGKWKDYVKKELLEAGILTK